MVVIGSLICVTIYLGIKADKAIAVTMNVSRCQLTDPSLDHVLEHSGNQNGGMKRKTNTREMIRIETESTCSLSIMLNAMEELRQAKPRNT